MSRIASILIVDDDPTIRQNIHFILEKGGMKSSMASSGEEGLQRMRTTAFDARSTTSPRTSRRRS